MNLTVKISISEEDSDYFLKEIYELFEDAEVSMSGIDVHQKGIRTFYFVMLPEILTDKVGDIFALASQMFDGEMTVL